MDLPRDFSEIHQKILEKSNIKSVNESLRNCPNRCQRVSKEQCKKMAKFQTAVSICQFLCPGMLLYSPQT